MCAFRTYVCLGVGTVLLAGCAVSPEAASRRQAMEASIEAILAESLQIPELGKPSRCLAERQYDNIRILDERRILFSHRRGEYWINDLGVRCPDLRYADVLRVRTFSHSRICAMDSFYANEWFEWPWYRRWPWYWSGWGTEIRCILGDFHPVSAAQVAEIAVVLGR